MAWPITRSAESRVVDTLRKRLIGVASSHCERTGGIDTLWYGEATSFHNFEGTAQGKAGEQPILIRTTW